MSKAKKTKRSESNRKGNAAEIWAGLYLRAKGYKILKHRYKCPVGEIDLIALKRKSLIAVEVKYRNIGTHDPEQALTAITHQNKKRVTNALNHFLMMHAQYMDHDIRFDAIAMTSPFRICHLDNAWQANSYY